MTVGLTVSPARAPEAFSGKPCDLLTHSSGLCPNICAFSFCAQDPELQCLLLSDGKSSLHPSHVVILPGDSSSSMAAISFTGALRIPVSVRVGEGGP